MRILIGDRHRHAAATVGCIALAVRWLVGVLVVSLLQHGPGSLAQSVDAPEGSVVERQAVRLVEQRLRLTPRRGAGPGVCANVALDELEIRHRGVGVPPERRVALERASERLERVLHLILLDTSRSMQGELELGRQAAAAYVDTLDLTRDRVALMTFDDDVLLLQAPTDNAEAFEAALDDARIGGTTAFYDALELALDAAQGSLHDRVIAVVVTDALDSASRADGRITYERVRDRLDWTVHSIGLNLPPMRGGRRISDPAGWLSRLADTTGGTFLRVDGGTRLDKAFARLARDNAREVVLTILDDRCGLAGWATCACDCAPRRIAASSESGRARR